MKKYTSAMVAGLAALAIASSATAQTNVIHITGSTAFRKATIIAIGNILTPGYKFGCAGAAGSGTLATSISGATYAEFQGTIGANPVDITCYWSGSVGGVQTLTSQTNVTGWLSATNLSASGEYNINTSGANPEPTVTSVADVSMSDSFQGSTAFTTPAVHDTVVGVVPFEWVRNVGSPASMSNMTALVAQALLGAGSIPLSQWTGQNADASTGVYAVGRNADSGTRLDAFAESGYGIFTPPIQYIAEYSGTVGSAGTITNLDFYPAETINGIPYGTGNSGYSSGGTLAKVLGTPGSGSATTPGWLVGYLGTSDAATAVGLGAVAMTYNGVAYSATAVQEGAYSFWAYEHLMYLPSLASAKKTVADAIATQIKNTDAVQSGVLIGSMNVSRPVEGGVIQHN